MQHCSPLVRPLFCVVPVEQPGQPAEAEEESRRIYASFLAAAAVARLATQRGSTAEATAKAEQLEEELAANGWLVCDAIVPVDIDVLVIPGELK